MDRHEIQQRLMALRNDLRAADREMSNEILSAQDETDRAGALLAERMTQLQLDEQEEITRHADAMSAIRHRRESALQDYGMALKAIDGRVRTLGHNLIEAPREATVKVVK